MSFADRLSTVELARELGISRQRITYLREKFYTEAPQPDSLGGRLVWRKRHVESFRRLMGKLRTYTKSAEVLA